MAPVFSYSKKSVVVMGGTSGINKAIAMRFAEAGARVCVASRSQEKVDATVNDLNRVGEGAFGYTVDVRDATGVAEVFKQASATFGQPLDVVISGAAGNFPAKAKTMSANAFKSVVDIDLLGTFNVLRAAYDYLSKPGAAIINISAPQALLPSPLQSHVCAAKAGVDMITRTLAIEWGGVGIRVNSVVPGPIEGTEGMRRLAPTDDLLTFIKGTVPLKRNGTTGDIANACLWLCSDYASYINGVVLPVDGGWSLSGWSVCAAEMDKLFDQFNAQ